MAWRLQVMDYEVLSELARRAAADESGLLAADADVAPTRERLQQLDEERAESPFVEFREFDGRMLTSALLHSGALDPDVRDLASPIDISLFLDEELARDAFDQLAHLSRIGAMRLDARGRFSVGSKPGTTDRDPRTVAETLWSQLRTGWLIFSECDIALYAAKVSRLLEGAVVVPDGEVRVALEQLGLNGLQPWLFALDHDEWESHRPPSRAPFMKLLALLYIAADLWAEDARYRKVVQQYLPSLSGRTGRLLEILLATAVITDVDPQTCFRFERLGRRWYEG